jgi:hypothetical protein
MGDGYGDDEHQRAEANIDAAESTLGSYLVLETVPDRDFGSGSGSKPNCCQTGGPGG